MTEKEWEAAKDEAESLDLIQLAQLFNEQADRFKEALIHNKTLEAVNASLLAKIERLQKHIDTLERERLKK